MSGIWREQGGYSTRDNTSLPTRGGLFVLMCCCTALSLQAGCRKKAKKAAPKLQVTEATSETEERNLRALCAAAAEVRKQPGVQDRLARIAEIAAPTSATTELLDGLIALEGPKRLSVLKGLVAKYGITQECRTGLPAFEVAAEAPPPNAPMPPNAGQQVDPSSVGANVPQPFVGGASPGRPISDSTVASNMPAGDSSTGMGVRGAAPVYPAGRGPGTASTMVAAVTATAARPAYGGFRGRALPVNAQQQLGRQSMVRSALSPAASVATPPSSSNIAPARSAPGPSAMNNPSGVASTQSYGSGSARPVLALPVGRMPAAVSRGKQITNGGYRGMAPPLNSARPTAPVSAAGQQGGLKGLEVPGLPLRKVSTPEAPAVGGARFAPGGVRVETSTPGKAPRFAPGGTRAD